MSLSQLDSEGLRLAFLGADGVLSVWSHVQGSNPVLGQKVRQYSIHYFKSNLCSLGLEIMTNDAFYIRASYAPKTQTKYIPYFIEPCQTKMTTKKF